MLSYREVATAFADLQIPSDSPVIVHGSISSFGQVKGGADTIIGAICAMAKKVIMPSFTYQTMVTPLDGPENNGMIYGISPNLNLMAEIYTNNLPVDPSIGELAERFRSHPQAKRSTHPILSFTAINMDIGLDKQSVIDPLSPIGFASENKGWVLLLGVSQSANTSIHYAEKLAGRKQFIRWALTEDGVVECAGMPGCSNGFDSASKMIEGFTRKVNVNGSLIQAIPLNFLIHSVQSALAKDPFALLCDNPDCIQCSAIRNDHETSVLQVDSWTYVNMYSYQISTYIYLDFSP